MNPTIKLIAAFAVGFAIPAMAATDQTWYPAQDAKTKKCAVIEKKPAGAAYTISAAARHKRAPSNAGHERRPGPAQRADFPALVSDAGPRPRYAKSSAYLSTPHAIALRNSVRNASVSHGP